MEIIPAILPKDFDEIETKVGEVRSLAKMIQIDLCDGIFVPSKTWPYNGTDVEQYRSILDEQDGMPFWDEVSYEFDCMVKNASEDLQMLITLGAKRIIFHLEAEDNLEEFFKSLDSRYREYIDFGLAINLTTPLASIEPFLNQINFVQCMGIDPIGIQGAPFKEEVIEKVEQLKTKYPNLMVSVDGGVDLDNAEKLKEVGVDRLVVGHSIFSSEDPLGTLESFQALV